MSNCHTEKNTCDTSVNKTACDSTSKQAGNQSEGQCTLAADLQCLAKQAKKELLKEKMKAHFEAKQGAKFDKIAELAVDAAIACCEQKIASREACADYQSKLSNILASSL